MRDLEYEVQNIELGTVTIKHSSALDRGIISGALHAEGFELVEDKKAALVGKIKALIIDLVHKKGISSVSTNISKYLSDQLGKDYHYLSTVFSQIENVTIEKFVILQKIERAKELLIYDELTLSEIAHQLGYSSVAYLSSQFKQVTGFTPTEFKKLKSHHRIPLDEIGIVKH